MEPEQQRSISKRMTMALFLISNLDHNFQPFKGAARPITTCNHGKHASATSRKFL